MKTITVILSFLIASSCFAQAHFEVKMATTPVAKPNPLLKLYGNQPNTDYEPYVAPTYTAPSTKQIETNTKPAAVTYRVLGDKFTMSGKEVITMIIEVSTNYSGYEVVKVTEYKTSTSEYWEKLSLSPTASSTKGTSYSAYYNYKVYLAIGEVYFNF